VLDPIHHSAIPPVLGILCIVDGEFVRPPLR
jgi:hypothetical protein